MTQVIGSVVTFNPQWDLLEKTLRTFLASAPDSFVVVWDNSPEDRISSQLQKAFPERVIYHKSPENFGYGKGNNQVFERYHTQGSYFCVINPDLEIPHESLPTLLDFMASHPQWGLVTGSICNPQGQVDPVHKKMPSFLRYALEFSVRKFFGVSMDKSITHAFLNFLERPCRLPILSGCFMLFSCAHFKELQGFDERFFLYFEDTDLSLRSYLRGRSLILPQVKIIHAWGRQSHKKFSIFLLHLKSALKFYNKWGLSGKIPDLVNKHVGYFDPQNPAPNLLKDL